MPKYEWKKSEKQWYAPTSVPQEVVLPSFGFFVIDGKGDPNGPEFAECVGALYALTYGVRMSAKAGLVLAGFFEYTVYPLEGLWDLSASPKALGAFNKSDLVYRVMIRQPDFVDEAVAALVIEAVKKKKSLSALDRVHFERMEEGRCLQVLHTGPYDTEPASFAKMQDFCRKYSLAKIGHRHREIYLSDPSKAAPETMKTILRIPVRDHFACD